MYITGVIQALDNVGIEAGAQRRIQQFKDYPLREYMELLLDAAVTLSPEDLPKEGLRRLGQLAIPTFAHSIVGGVIMSTVGKNWELCLKMVSRGYEVSLKPGKAVVAELSNDRALVQLRGIWNFGDSYQVGVIEGLMQSCDIRGTVVVEALSKCDPDLRLHWEDRRSRRPNTGREDRPSFDAR